MKKYSAPNSQLRSVFSRNLFSSRLKSLLAAVGAFFLFSEGAAFAQTTYSWTNGGTGGSWTSSSNWTTISGSGSTFPSVSGTSGDTANLGNASSNRNFTSGGNNAVTLGTSESIASLTFNQTAAYTNELVIGSGSTTTLTLANALTIGGNSSGTELVYLDSMDNAGAAGLTDNGGTTAGVTVSSGGVVELSSTSTKTAIVNSTTGVTIASGGILNIDQGDTGGPSSGAISTVGEINGALTISSSGTVNLSSANSGGTALTGTLTTNSYYDTRFTVTGNFTDSGAITVSHAANTTTTNEIYFTGGTSATFNSTATGVSSLNGLIWNSGGASYTIASDVALPMITARPTITGTPGILTLETVTSPTTSTLSAAGINIYSYGTTSTPEISLGSNLTLTSVGIVMTHNAAGTPFVLNTNSYTLDFSSGAGVFQTSDQTSPNGVNWTLEGSGGTIKGTYINLSNNTSGTTVVNSGLTLLAVGGTALTNNLGNATSGSSIDAASTFEYTGASATSSSENFVTSNLAIGNLQVGTGSGTPVLGVSTAALTVGGNIAVNAGATLDLNGQNVTESHGSDSVVGGLTGSGTVLDKLASSTGTLTLDTTNGNGSFSGMIENNSGSGGTVSLVKVGTGTQTFSGANTYTGATNVNAGTLALATGGSLSSGTSVTVAAGASFGTATTNAAKMNIFSSNSTATLTLNLGTSTSTQSNLQLNLYSAGNNDLINAGTLTLNNAGTGNTFLLTLDNPTSATLSGPYTVLSWTSGTLALNQVTLAPSDPSGTLTLGSNDLIFTPTAAPEPSTWALLLGGLTLLVVWRRRWEGSSA